MCIRDSPRASPSPAVSTLANLGSIPLDCRSPAELWPQHPGPWPVAFGRQPVWIRSVSRSPGGGAAVIELTPNSATTWGYSQKLLWIVEPGFTGKVTISALNTSTGKRVYMRFGNSSPALVSTLDPLHPGVANSGDPDASDPQLHYSESPMQAFFDAAGCIEFTATWTTGLWSGTVAAGRVD